MSWQQSTGQLEQQIALRSLREAEGKMSIPLLVSWGMPERSARSLVEGWELRGWLRPSYKDQDNGGGALNDSSDDGDEFSAAIPEDLLGDE